MDAPPEHHFSELDLRNGCTRLWARGLRGQGVTVAVLDTGIDPIAILGDSVVLVRDFTGEHERPRGPDVRHGTKMAMAIRVVAPAVKIADFKVLPANSMTRRKDVIEAIHYCIQERPRYQIINLSLSFPPGLWRHNAPGRCSLCKAVEEASDAGILVIAASGNTGEGRVQCPVVTEAAFSVAATRTSADRAWWAAQGRLRLWWLKQTGRLAKHYGTSFSAAYMSGGVALLLSAVPGLSVAELREGNKQVGRRLSGLKPGEDFRAMNFEAYLEWLVGKEKMEKLFPWPYTSRITFHEALRQLYSVANNTFAQDNQLVNQLVTEALDIAVPVFADLVDRDPLAVQQVQEIIDFLVPGRFPEHEQRLRELGWPIMSPGCENITDSERAVVRALRLGRDHPYASGAAKTLHELLLVDAATVSEWYRARVREYLTNLQTELETHRQKRGQRRRSWMLEDIINPKLAELEGRWSSEPNQAHPHG